MKDGEILARFDGRGRAAFSLGGFEASNSEVIAAIAYECGYDLEATERPSRISVRLIYVRNDSPPARRRAAQTRQRLRAGGPLLPVWGVPGPQPGTVCEPQILLVESPVDKELAGAVDFPGTSHEALHGGLRDVSGRAWAYAANTPIRMPSGCATSTASGSPRSPVGCRSTCSFSARTAATSTSPATPAAGHSHWASRPKRKGRGRSCESRDAFTGTPPVFPPIEIDRFSGSHQTYRRTA